MSGWSIRTLQGTPSELHAADLPFDGAPTLCVMDPTVPTLVLGSTQPLRDADQAAAAASGVEVARRRTGGGAVLVRPGDLLWVDVLLPRGDPRWDDDVVRSSRWLGAAFVAALDAVGLRGAQAHDGPLQRTRWSSLACFAALGPGEVSLGGRKVVGISQRRTRAGARFQCSVLLDGDPADLVSFLALEPSAAAELGAVLRHQTVTAPVTSATLLASLQHALPR